MMVPFNRNRPETAYKSKPSSSKTSRPRTVESSSKTSSARYKSQIGSNLDLDFDFPTETSLITTNIQLALENSNILSEKQSSLLFSAIHQKSKLKQSYQNSMKEKVYAGVAPTRFNLQKQKLKTLGKSKNHQWLSNQSRLYWEKIKKSVLSNYSEEDIDMQDKAVSNSSKTMTQGLKCTKIITRPNSISLALHHLKIPVHYQDGTLGIESDRAGKRAQEEVEDDDILFEDYHTPGVERVFSLAIVESTSVFSVCEVSLSIPDITTKMEFELEAITYLSKYCLYAGLINQRKIKVYAK